MLSRLTGPNSPLPNLRGPGPGRRLRHLLDPRPTGKRQEFTRAHAAGPFGEWLTEHRVALEDMYGLGQPSRRTENTRESPPVAIPNGTTVPVGNLPTSRCWRHAVFLSKPSLEPVEPVDLGADPDRIALTDFGVQPRHPPVGAARINCRNSTDSAGLNQAAGPETARPR